MCCENLLTWGLPVRDVELRLEHGSEGSKVWACERRPWR